MAGGAAPARSHQPAPETLQSVAQTLYQQIDFTGLLAATSNTAGVSAFDQAIKNCVQGLASLGDRAAVPAAKRLLGAAATIAQEIVAYEGQRVLSADPADLPSSARLTEITNALDGFRGRVNSAIAAVTAAVPRGAGPGPFASADVAAQALRQNIDDACARFVTDAAAARAPIDNGPFCQPQAVAGGAAIDSVSVQLGTVAANTAVNLQNNTITLSNGETVQLSITRDNQGRAVASFVHQPAGGAAPVTVSYALDPESIVQAGPSGNAAADQRERERSMTAMERVERRGTDLLTAWNALHNSVAAGNAAAADSLGQDGGFGIITSTVGQALTKAGATFARFENIEWRAKHLEGLDFSGATFEGTTIIDSCTARCVRWVDTVFKGECRINDNTFCGGTWKARFEGSATSEFNRNRAYGGDTSFNGTDFGQIRVRNNNFLGAQFDVQAASLNDAGIARTGFFGSSPFRAQFSGCQIHAGLGSKMIQKAFSDGKHGRNLSGQDVKNLCGAIRGEEVRSLLAALTVQAPGSVFFNGAVTPANVVNPPGGPVGSFFEFDLRTRDGGASMKIQMRAGDNFGFDVSGSGKAFANGEETLAAALEVLSRNSRRSDPDQLRRRYAGAGVNPNAGQAYTVI